MGPDQAINTFRFSTDAVPARDRVAMFREEVGRQWIRLEFEPRRDVPLHARFSVRQLPRLIIAQNSLSPMVVRRTMAMIAPGEDDFYFLINLSGHTEVAQRNSKAACGPGDALLMASAEPLCAFRSGACRSLSLRIPRDALSALVPNPDDATLEPIPRDVEALRLLRSYVGTLDQSPGLTAPELRQAVVSHIHELIGLAVTGKRAHPTPERGGVRAARLTAIKRDVLMQLSRTRLTAKTMARAHGVSDRYVHLLFAETGQSFGDFVEQERMRVAFEALTDPARAAERIGDIAAEVGYPELSSFDRAFRRRFDAAPSEIRRVRSRGAHGE